MRKNGSNHPRFDQKELPTLPAPDVVSSYREEIADKVQESITAWREARQSLEEAKTMVREGDPR